MDRDKIYKMHGINRDAVYAKQKEIVELKESDLEVISATNVEDLLTHIEAIATVYADYIFSGKKIENDSGASQTILFIKYLRRHLNLLE